jgi:segregation and condensation protein A
VLDRQVFEAEEIHASESGTYRNATLFDLLKALKRAIEKAPEKAEPHVVTRFPITVEEKSEEIIHILKTKTAARFFELVSGLAKMHIVVTFLALLELAKLQRIRVQQDLRFDDIVIVERKDDDDQQTRNDGESSQDSETEQ